MSTLAATQHHLRLLTPEGELGCQRDQRLLPKRVDTRLCPRFIALVPRLVATCLLACWLVEGLSMDYASSRGWAQLSGEPGLSGALSGI